jgi:hypothetical protein
MPAPDDTARWTKGPWRYKRGDSFDHGEDGPENGFEIVLSGAPESGQCRVVHLIRYAENIFPEDEADHAEAEANSTLIAAAPSLYEALKDITDCYGVGSTPEKFVEHVHDFMMAGRAALALARGKRGP